MWPHGLQHTRLPCSSSYPWICSNSCSLSNAIQPSPPLSPPSPLALHPSQNQGLFQWDSSLHQVAKALELQHQSFQWIFRVDFLYDWLLWSPCCPRDSQESSPAPQFKSNDSLALSLLYGPTHISIHDYWKNHMLLFGKVISHPHMTTWKTIALTV